MNILLCSVPDGSLQKNQTPLIPRMQSNKEHSWKNGYKKKNSLLLNLDYYIWKMKVKYWKNFSVIAPSKWIYNLAKWRK